MFFKTSLVLLGYSVVVMSISLSNNIRQKRQADSDDANSTESMANVTRMNEFAFNDASAINDAINAWRNQSSNLGSSNSSFIKDLQSRLEGAFNATMTEEGESLGNSLDSNKQLIRQKEDTKSNLTTNSENTF